MTNLDVIRRGWDKAAREDAMFYIITDPSKANGGWTPEEFFAHGQREIDDAMEYVEGVLEEAGLELERGRALDFGCGVGRLTQALAAHFRRVDGVDISPEMIELADQYNHHAKRVHYKENSERLPFRASSFDFIYSIIVLQHMPRALARAYASEFVRVLKPGGIVHFELPEGPDYPHPIACLSMWTATPEEVEGWLDEDGAKLLAVRPSFASGHLHAGWEYTARKQAPK